MSAKEFIKIYDLKDDIKFIENIHRATLKTKNFGLKIEHGVPGTAEWWYAIEDNVIPIITLDGVISNVFMSGHNDFPEFEITSDSTKSTWERQGKEEYYVIGRRVKISYIIQKYKKPIGDLAESKLVLKIEIAK